MDLFFFFSPVFSCIHLFLTVLGLRCNSGFSLVVDKGVATLVEVQGLPIAVASHGAWALVLRASEVVVPGL